MSPSTAGYFDLEPGKSADLKTEGLSWIDTPFREFYEQQFADAKAELAILDPDFVIDIKGPAGGIDCIGLCEEIFNRVGATDEFIFPRIPADYQSHQLDEKVLDWLRGALEDPQSKLLGAIFGEVDLPDPEDAVPADFFHPGDLIVMKHGKLFHMPIIIDEERHFVNALPRLGVVPGTIQDDTFSTHIVAVFRLLALPELTEAEMLALSIDTPSGYRVRVTDYVGTPIYRLTEEDPSDIDHWEEVTP